MEMKIDALAGTLESSDVMVRIGPAAQPGIQLEIDSIVKQQFGTAIEQVVRETLAQLGVSCGPAYRPLRYARRNSPNCHGVSYETSSQYAVHPWRQCRHVKHIIRLRRRCGDV